MSDEPSEPADSRFLFVNPSDPGGRIDAYSGESTPRTFVRASWDWIYERLVRRRVLAELPVQSFSYGTYVGSRAGAYRLVGLVPSRSAGLPEAPLAFDAEADLPSASGTVAPETVVRLVPELVKLAYDVAEWSYTGRRVSWCDPSAPFAPRTLDASATESTVSYPGDGGASVSSTSVSSVPFRASDAVPVFRTLFDQRMLDGLSLEDVEVWDPAEGRYVSRRVAVSRVLCPVSADDDPDHGAYERTSVGALVASLSPHGSQWVSSFTKADALPCRDDMDLSKWSGAGDAYARGGKTSAKDALGVMDGPPAASETGPAVVSVESGSHEFGVCAMPDWGGEPTCWASWGFPHVGDGSVFERQMSALCRTAPLVPPFSLRGIPGRGLPAGDESAEGAYGSAYYGFYGRDVAPYAAAEGWAGGPVPSCLPAEISRVLDRLSVAVYEVPYVFAYLESSRRLETRTVHDGAETVAEDSTSKSGSVACTPSALLDYAVLQGSGRYVSAVVDRTVTEPLSGSATTVETRTEDDVRRSVSGSSAVRGLVPLRTDSGVPAGLSARRTVNGSTSSSGSAVRDPPPESAMMFPAALRRWMKSVRLVLVADVSAEPLGDGLSSVETVDGAAGTDSAYAAGSRTYRRRVSAVEVGRLDLETGALGSADLSALLAAAAPPGSVDPGVRALYGSYRSVSVRTKRETADGWDDRTDVETTRTSDPSNLKSETSARICAVVEWDFDAEDPPRGDLAGGGLALRLYAAEALVAAAEAALARAGSAAGGCSEALDALSARLDALDALLSGDASASDELSAAEGDLASAQQALSAAQSDLADAQSDLASAQSDLASAAEGEEGLAAALRSVASARDLEDDRRAAVAAAQARVSALQTAGQALREDAESAVQSARSAVSAAQGAVEALDLDGAADGVSAARTAVAAARAGISGDSAASLVSAAETAAESAKSSAEGVEADALSASLDASSASASVSAAEGLVWAWADPSS